MAKVRLKDGDRSPLPVLAYVLQASLRLLHPIMPFVSEYIWQHLRDHVDGLEEALIIAAYPLGEGERDIEAERGVDIATLQPVPMVRDATREIERSNRRRVRVQVAPDPSLPDDQREYLRVTVTSALATNAAISMTGSWDVLDRIQIPSDDKGKFLTTGPLQMYIPLEGLIDLHAERERVKKDLLMARAQADRLSQKLADTDFRSKAPADVVARQEEMLASAKSRLAALEQRLAELG
jgi:valyl-tRNA synthetase